ncbi:shikimate dehydrogenase [Alteromonas oceanisediminis]|uniref:shikimate dehydrogenase n=1 Tax=Alteromonas oceanisediminis TaxID=2836180 RepID=UPI001BDAF8A9|nr:shikimate dehydrogenase [Alteromonas oceanisediminis]MBT0586647.1 shikimate dehydrogenase [Alteromonas oceanisediminis]
MIKLAVFGNPIQQSKSPQIHHAFARQCGLSIDYQPLLVEEGHFNTMARAFLSQMEARGCNVTAPCKLDAHAFADALTPIAELTGAVNTLHKQPDGVILGHNTDGGGLIDDILSQHIRIHGSRVLLIGAGGAARGVLPSLLAEMPKHLTIVNRTVHKANALEAIHRAVRAPSSLSLESFHTLTEDSFDIIINATSLSLTNQVPELLPSIVKGSQLVYDMVYAPQRKPFLDWALDNGATAVSDGLGMLVGQAALSFEMWTGHKPDSAEVIKHLRQQL